MRPLHEALPGSWSLESFNSCCEDGRQHQPLGPRPQGRLHYGADGRMLAALAHTEQPALGVSRLEEAPTAPTADRAAAFAHFVCYGGRWSVEESTVVHEVELAAVADVVGHVHRRRAQLEGERLVLSYDRRGRSGKRWTHSLCWRRMP